MEWVLLAGRIIFGGFFVINGVNHLLNRKDMGGYAASKGVPASELAVVLTGIMLLVGGLSVIFGVFPVVGLAVLIAFLVPVAVVMHNFWAVEDPGQRVAEQVNFMKNIALAGAALALMYGAGSWPMVVG